MTPDNDKNSAVQKVVDAFRARRAGESDPAAAEPTDTPDTDAADTDAAAPAETSVIKIEPGQTPGGGDSESPTKAFAIPAAAAAAGQDTEETPLPEVDGDEDEAAQDEAAEPESDDATDEAPAEEAPATEDPADEAAADEAATDEAAADEAGTDEAAADETSADDPATDERETTVVAIPGTGERAETPARRATESVDPDADPRAPIVEHPIELGETEAEETESAEAATEIIDAAAVSAATNAAAPTEQIEVPAEVAAAAAAAEAEPAEQAWSTGTNQPEVIAPAAATDEPKKGRSRAGLWGAIVVALLIVAAVLIWFFAFNESEQDKVAAAAETYQTAMADGDLETLKAITCGEQYAIYADISPEQFTQAYESQKSRNQMMLFKDINAVAVDGDTARVGVDVYSTDDPNTTTSAQVTLSKINGEWKVCAKP